MYTDLPTVVLACHPFGRPALLVLVLPREASSLLGAFWGWSGGRVTEAPIGRA